MRNHEGHPAKFGIDGDMDPAHPMNALADSTSTAQALVALDQLLKLTVANEVSLDSGEIGLLGLQVKKGNKSLATQDWTPECQAKLQEVVRAL